ncbi:iron-sulfur cluster assembly 1 homolog, mitochondrial [Trichonephila clavata]|uniref:Iron-sulfur cluster assembly 1 homolog, mitochondrial n=1 Tax=Trichonephila clavata TaxID=2740835 RepID=A0A8X6HU20_TRICU|nr:iron-sulfur cluster assembly 1 homolog, mitochondrial [Trichonephila clavata]
MSRSLGAATVRLLEKSRKIPTKAALVLTPSAVNQVKKLLNLKPEAIGLKISVSQRGCNGLSYSLEYASKKGKFDEVVSQDGVKVLIDMKAQLTLLGTEMDFQESPLASEFVFNNPNIKGTCGCGESFTV